MRLAIASRVFYPSVGGIETASMLVATGLVELGHAVTVITHTQAAEPDQFPFRVVRRPTALDLLRRVAESDVYWQNHISLRDAWPGNVLRKPWVVTVCGYLALKDMRELAKRWALRLATCVSVSRSVARDLGIGSVVIPNPYDDSTFRPPGSERPKELVFVGRLVPGKGVGILLGALGLLAQAGIRPQLTVIGRGPDGPHWAAEADRLGVASQVNFVGTQTGARLAALLGEHRIMVVPSLSEAFGIVAVEGIACGCVVVGSDSGGLPEAIGPCGVTVPKGNPPALAEALARLLRDSERENGFRRNAPAHLANFTRLAVARRYERLFQSLLEPTHGAHRELGQRPE